MSVGVESVQIQNVVASSGIGQELDLEALLKDLPHAEYNPDSFPGLIYRMQDPKAAALIFRSGKVVCTGAQSIENVKTALRHVFDTLRELGIPVVEAPDVEVQNVVSNADLGHSLNLNAIAIGLGLEHVEYEPEQFPGLVYRLQEPDVVTLLFGSGKVVITGAKQIGDAEKAIQVIQEQLSELKLLE